MLGVIVLDLGSHLEEISRGLEEGNNRPRVGHIIRACSFCSQSIWIVCDRVGLNLK
jgi:hypothetical protein